jgi:hypothetical protein
VQLTRRPSGKVLQSPLCPEYGRKGLTQKSFAQPKELEGVVMETTKKPKCDWCGRDDVWLVKKYGPHRRATMMCEHCYNSLARSPMAVAVKIKQ